MSFAAYFPPQFNVVRSPRQAANTYTNVGGFPRQKHVFIARFVTTTTGPIMQNFGNLTFAVKNVDRPRFNLKTEEMNEYNKKRVIHTGFKLDPIKMTFYDGSDGAAQHMIAAYCQYYFGDLMGQGTKDSTNFSYSYDATMSLFRDFSGSGFGFNAKNGQLGSLNFGIDAIDGLTSDAMWFFDRLEVYHFYDSLYDVYYYHHPRIDSVDMGDLDYSSSDVTMVNMIMKSENLEYYPQNPVAGSEFEEFSNQFNGNPLAVPDVFFPIQNILPNDQTQPSNPSISSLLTSTSAVAGLTDPLANFRYSSAPSTGPLTVFGSFNFGPSTVGATPASTDLLSMTVGNPSLTSALNTGSNPNSLSATSNLTFTQAISNGGLNPALYDVVNSTVQTATTNPLAASFLAKGLVPASIIDGSKATTTSNGVTLPLTSYGVINAQQTGTAQYGFNPVP